jgi:aldehyde dehydrogenase (NAD+)
MKPSSISETLSALGIQEENFGATTGLKWIATRGAGTIQSDSPVDGNRIASVYSADADAYEKVLQAAAEAFVRWRAVPAPQRGEIVRQIGLQLREYKNHLGRLVSYEMGKSLQEGWGEVQEMIDIADFAVGQSRQLYGYTMHSERPEHRMYDQYHPLGVVGVITVIYNALLWPI